MIRLLLLLLACLAIMACDPETTDMTGHYKLPPELQKCKIFEMEGNPRILYVVQCPSFVSTGWDAKNGKTTIHHSTTTQNAEIPE